MFSSGLRLAALLALILQLPQSPVEVSPQTQRHLHEIMETLPSDSTLLRLLQNGAHGDGVHYSWMDEMRHQGVKCVRVEIHLTWFFGPRLLKVARVMYFTDYDNPDSQVTDPERIKSFQSNGLEEKLKEVALKRGHHGWWFEDPPHQHPSLWWPVPAAVQVDLLDDEFLPVFPPHYWNFDTSQGALVRAVAASDRFDIQKILSEGKLDTRDLGEALGWAASERDSNTVQALLHAGANVNWTNKSGYTALMGAINNHRIANAKMLLDVGADVNVRLPIDGDTALTLPLYYKRDASEGVLLLLSRGADPNTANSVGRTALMLAIFGQPDIVIRSLLQSGAKVNTQDRNGNTALIAAAEYNNVQVVRLLLGAGAERTLKNKNGQTALAIALDENHAEVVQLLTH